MLGLPILDVAIGLIFIYLLLSLVVSAANEVLASLLRWRANMLWKGIETLIGDADTTAKLYSHPLIDAFRRQSLFGKDKKQKPSYLPAREFVLALLDTLAPADVQRTRTDRLRAALAASSASAGQPVPPPAAGQPAPSPPSGQPAPPPSAGQPALPPQVARALAVLLEDAGGDLEKFKRSVETWFDAAMDRMSGWYKRRLQWVTLVLALLVTVGANLDTIAVGNVLWRDPSLRAALVAQAQTFVQEAQQQEGKGPAATAAGPATQETGPPPPPARMPFETAEASPEERLQANLERLQSIAIPVGWKEEDCADPLGAAKRHAFGWLLTALAVSLGAPFWFDLLKKVISIRSAGKAPEEAKKASKPSRKQPEAEDSSTPEPEG